MAAENGAEQKISAISNRTFFMIKIRSHDRGDNQRSPAELWVCGWPLEGAEATSAGDR